MEALLLAAQAGVGESGGGNLAGQQTQDLAAVQEAFGDTQGAALVSHFAGSEAAAPGGEAGDGALAALLGSAVGGSETAAFVPFDFNTMLDDPSAAAAAQV